MAGFVRVVEARQSCMPECSIAYIVVRMVYSGGVGMLVLDCVGMVGWYVCAQSCWV